MRRKELILKLREEGKTYNEISRLLGCSKSVVSYHCSGGKKYRDNLHPYSRKLEKFKSKFVLSNYYSNHKPTINKLLYDKVNVFLKGEIMKSFTIKDVIAKFGENPKCYLTGQEINIYEPKTYEFDHIIPKSRGGTNTIDNLGICLKNVNRAKGTMTPDEFINLCQMVINYKNNVAY